MALKLPPPPHVKEPPWARTTPWSCGTFPALLFFFPTEFGFSWLWWMQGSNG